MLIILSIRNLHLYSMQYNRSNYPIRKRGRKDKTKKQSDIVDTRYASRSRLFTKTKRKEIIITNTAKKHILFSELFIR